MSGISTHVLDTARGRAASGVPVALEILGDGGTWRALGRGETDADGRFKGLLPSGTALAVGEYRLTFATKAYFEATGEKGFYPEVVVRFEVRDAGQHHHVPLLLSPFGYSTYRGT